jgi:transformation/transcription domain-associated protein
MDIVNTQDYGLYLKYLFPVFYNTLRQGSPQLQDGPEQKIRNILLEVLSRLPTTDLLK